MSVFIMMIGIPGSGKSTWVKNFIEKAGSDSEWVVISSDDYIEKKAALESKTYTEVFSTYAKDAEKACLASVKFAIENDANIIWDQTNLTRKVREKRLALIPDSYSKYYFYQEAPNYEELQRRLADRPGKEIPFDVLLNMIKTAEPPALDEGFNGVVK